MTLVPVEPDQLAAGLAVALVPVAEVRNTPAVPVESLYDATANLLAAGVPDATRRAYASDRADWRAWCRQQGQPALPVSAEGLALYVTHLLTVGSANVPNPRPLAPASVTRRLSAISTYSTEQGSGRPDLRPARLVLRGHARQHKASTPGRAAPVSVATLRVLVEQAMAHRDLEGRPTLRAFRDRTILLLGFALGARRSELPALDLEDLTVVAEGLSVRITRSKTSDVAADVAVPWATDKNICPCRAFIAYRDALAARGVTSGPLLRRITRTGALGSRLTAASVGTVVTSAAEAAGLPVPPGFAGWTGHSLRRGMATEARKAGADPLRIARQGGWVDGSRALNGYIADADRWSDHPLRGVL